MTDRLRGTMRPMRRGMLGLLFAFVSATSLVLCLALLIGWRTGASEPGDERHPFDRRLVGVGAFRFFIDRSVLAVGLVTPTVERKREVFVITEDSAGILGRPGGFHAVRWMTAIGDTAWFYSEVHTFRGILMPAWFAVMITAILPAMSVLRLVRRHRRRLSGRCRACGYDLRAHATGERCPECGTVVSRRV